MLRDLTKLVKCSPTEHLNAIRDALSMPYNPFCETPEVLGLLATAEGIKRAFCIPCIGAEYLDEGGLAFLQELGRQLGLKVRATAESSYWYMDKPSEATEKLDSLICSLQTDHRAVWFYRLPEIDAELDLVDDRKIDCGSVLGYPPCCVEWHQKLRRAEAERWYKANANSYANIKKQPLEKVFKGVDKFSQKKAVNRRMQDKKFPFAQHTVCPQCFADGSPTSLENSALAKLAKSANPAFHDLFIKGYWCIDSLCEALPAQ